MSTLDVSRATPQASDQRGSFFYFVGCKPFEKSRFHQINPRILPWVFLDFLAINSHAD